jgi:hypothetical protein
MWETRNVTPSFALASPRVVAERILQLIRSQRKYAVIPGIMWLVIWADAIFPSFVSWVLSRFFYTRDGVRYSWGRDPK